MDYIKEISPEQAVILWQESRLSLSRCYEKAPEILKVHGSVIGTLGNFSASIVYPISIPRPRDMVSEEFLKLRTVISDNTDLAI